MPNSNWWDSIDDPWERELADILFQKSLKTPERCDRAVAHLSRPNSAIRVAAGLDQGSYCFLDWLADANLPALAVRIERERPDGLDLKKCIRHDGDDLGVGEPLAYFAVRYRRADLLATALKLDPSTDCLNRLRGQAWSGTLAAECLHSALKQLPGLGARLTAACLNCADILLRHGDPGKTNIHGSWGLEGLLFTNPWPEHSREKIARSVRDWHALGRLDMRRAGEFAALNAYEAALWHGNDDAAQLALELGSPVGTERVMALLANAAYEARGRHVLGRISEDIMRREITDAAPRPVTLPRRGAAVL